MSQNIFPIILAFICLIIGLLLIKRFNTIGKEALSEAKENRAKKLNETQARIYETMLNFFDHQIIILMMQFAIVNESLLEKMKNLSQKLNSLNETESLELKNDFKKIKINFKNLDYQVEQLLITAKNKKKRLN